MAYNLLWVTIGNIIGGAGFVALGYLGASPKQAAKALAPAPAE
jgi:nitrite transporter